MIELDNNFTLKDINYKAVNTKVPQAKVLGSVSGTNISYENVLLGKIDELNDWVKITTKLTDKIETFNIKPFFYGGMLDVNNFLANTGQTYILTAITASTFIHGDLNILYHNNSMIRLSKSKFESNWQLFRTIQSSGKDYTYTLNTGNANFTTFSNFITTINGYYLNILQYNSYNQTNSFLLDAIVETRKQIENNSGYIPTV